MLNASVPSKAYSTTYDGHSVTVAQVPHFSRANSRPRLEECGRWLGEIVQARPWAWLPAGLYANEGHRLGGPLM